MAFIGVVFAQSRDAEFNRLADRYFDEVLLEMDEHESRPYSAIDRCATCRVIG